MQILIPNTVFVVARFSQRQKDNWLPCHLFMRAPKNLQKRKYGLHILSLYTLFVKKDLLAYMQLPWRPWGRCKRPPLCQSGRGAGPPPTADPRQLAWWPPSLLCSDGRPQLITKKQHIKGTGSPDGYGFCWHVWLDLGLSKARGWFWNFFEAPQICHWKKHISCGKCQHKLLYKIIKSSEPLKINRVPDLVL